MSELFRNFEDDFREFKRAIEADMDNAVVKSATITSNLRKLQETITNMETEVNDITQSQRAQYRSKVQQYRKDYQQLDSDFTKKKASMQRDALKGPEGSSPRTSMGSGPAESQRARATDTTKKLEDQQKMIDDSRRYIADTEAKGMETVGHLARQRETINRAIDTTREANSEIGRGRRIISDMMKTSVQNKLIMITIIIVLLLIIFLIIYFKVIKPVVGSSPPATDGPSVNVPPSVPNTFPPTPAPLSNSGSGGGSTSSQNATAFASLYMLCGSQITGTRPNAQGVSSYLGIQYAQSPVGMQRWQYAQEFQNGDCYWTKDNPNKALDATKYGYICHQIDTPSLNLMESEDCLNLDVHVPRGVARGSNVPVVFWISGGSNMDGHSSMYGNLTYLASELGAVVVSPNYRVGALGFLALKELSAQTDSGTSGNYGISDLVVALKWVQRNVRAFGGNPNDVTALGQSSGGTNILALLNYMSSHSESSLLFRKAIVLSSSNNMSTPLHVAEDLNAKYALQSSPCAGKSDVYRCLLSLSATDAKKLFSDVYMTPVIEPCHAEGCNSPKNPYLYLPLPIVDGYLLKKTMKSAMQQLPLGFEGILLQSMQCEGALQPKKAILETWNATAMKDWVIQDAFKDLGYDETLLGKLWDKYQNNPTFTTNQGRYQSLLADFGTAFANTKVARWIRDATNGRVNVLVGYVQCAPEKSFPVLTDRTTLPFHIWDYIAAANNFNFVKQNLLNSEGYTPTSRDLSFGWLLRQQWKSFIRAGPSSGVSYPWASFGMNEVVGVISCNGVSGIAASRRETEQALNAVMKNIPEAFWWIN
eukprot:PhF_6_TR515/c0_g1_i1/m.299